jgi:hypothetical protein
MLKSTSGGLALALFSWKFSSPVLIDFLKTNELALMVGLFAINSATLGVVLTKMRDIIDRINSDPAKEQAINPAIVYKNTREQMLLSIKEQIGLLLCAMILLVMTKASFVVTGSIAHFFVDVGIISVFMYDLMIMYDTSCAVLTIIDVEF